MVAENASSQLELYWVHGNHLGVPTVTTNAQGQVVTPGNAFLRPGFPGQSQVLSDLYYNRARDYDPVTGRYIQADPIGLGGGANPYLYANGDPVNLIDPLGLFDLRGAAGYVPVLGSGLDAYEAYNCGNYGWAAFHAGLALVDATGGGALVKGALVGGFKLSQRAAVKAAYKNVPNWDAMRKRLQRRGVIPVNSRPLNRNSHTVDHVIFKQEGNWPSWLLNHPANLQPGVPLGENSRRRNMSRLQQARYYPRWMKAGTAGIVSYAVGSTSSGGTKCDCR
nr:RHS repeat-associated core domain-containing protein [Erythrobacter ani]